MESKRKKILTFISEKPWVSRNKDGASPEGVDNLSDSSVTLNRQGPALMMKAVPLALSMLVPEAVLTPKSAAVPKQLTVLKGRVVRAATVTSVVPNAMVLRSFLETRKSFAPGLVLACFHRPWEGNIRVWC